MHALILGKLTDWRTQIRDALAARPSTYFPLYRILRSRSHGIVEEHTQITIEGFPRSANSFAVRAFLHANPGAVVAHHTHAPAQIMRSVQLELPTLVLVREPEAVLRSFLVYRPSLSTSAAAESYVRFYDAVLPMLSHLTLAQFEEVTQEYGRVIRAVNVKYGTTFHPFQHGREFSASVLRDVDNSVRRVSGDSALRTRRVAVPNPDREELKKQIHIEPSKSLLRARKVYRTLLERREPLPL